MSEKDILLFCEFTEHSCFKWEITGRGGEILFYRRVLFVQTNRQASD